MNYTCIRTQTSLEELLISKPECLRRHAFQGVDFSTKTDEALACQYVDCIFLGCNLPMGLKRQCTDSLFFPRMGEIFGFRSALYTAEELYEGYQVGKPDTYAQSFDGRVYRHYIKKGKQTSDIKETLARTLHDHSISDALHDYLSHWDERRVVGVMGGHGIARTERSWERVANISKRLTEDGFLMVTGGGPGAMEATHMGAWMAGRGRIEMTDAVHLMRTAPSFHDDGWLDTAMRIRSRFPQEKYQSLGIPTWLYGHEPSTPLASHIAKYFDNSIREDGILTIAMGGIIYTPGSAGTLQEIFQDAVQNHYLSFGYASPMIFMGVDYWTKEVPVWPLLQDLVKRGRYKNLLLLLSDSEDEIVDYLHRFARGEDMTLDTQTETAL